MRDLFAYIKLNKHFFCLNQNPISFAWFLFFKSKSLRQHSRFKTKKLIRSLKILTLFKLRLKKVNNIIKFPFFCHLILKVHGGFRAFDFKQKTVTKIISADSNASRVKMEIESIRKANQLDFAPRIVRWNIAEHWYEEEYVEGVIGYSLIESDPPAVLSLFRKEVIRCLKKMILLNPPIKASIGDVIKEFNDFWGYERLSRLEFEPEKLNAFIHFVQVAESKLLKHADQTIYLIFSHGDFSLQNILITKNGLKVIDWESISNRNLLYDLHNFFFTELYYNRASNFIANEIEHAIASLRSYLIYINYSMFNNLSELAEIYRWLYYIERIFMLLERGLSKQVLNVIYRSVQVFKEFEKSAVKQ